MADPQQVESERLRNFRLAWLHGIECMNRGDVEGAWGAVPEDIEFHPLPQFIEGVLHGRKELLAFFHRLREAFPDWGGELIAFHEPRDGLILVNVRMFGHGGATGLGVEGDLWQLWQFENDRPRTIWEFDSREAAEAKIGELA